MSENVATTVEHHELSLGDRLALERTQYAADRTLMAWIRTSFSMISFGFTLFKFFQYLKEEGVGANRPLAGPRNLSILLITLGTVALSLAAWEHWSDSKKRDALRGKEKRSSLPLIVSLAVVVIGLTAFVGLVLHAGPLQAP